MESFKLLTGDFSVALPKIEKGSWVPSLEEDPQVLMRLISNQNHSWNPGIRFSPPVEQDMRTYEHLVTNPTALGTKYYKGSKAAGTV